MKQTCPRSGITGIPTGGLQLGGGAAQSAASPAADAAAPAAPAAKTEFDVKLDGFDAAGKIATLRVFMDSPPA